MWQSNRSMEACELSSSYCVWLASWPPTGLSRYLFSRFVLALMYAEWRIVQLRPAIPLRHVSVEMQALLCLCGCHGPLTCWAFIQQPQQVVAVHGLPDACQIETATGLSREGPQNPSDARHIDRDALGSNPMTRWLIQPA